jgi:predicted ArsR family transcriptional regulator
MMNNDEAREAFLLELYRCTKADASAQASMYSLGAGIGMDKTEAKKAAEDLIGMGLVEIRTLSGGVGITAEGLAAVRKQGGAGDPETSFRLSSGPCIDERDRSALAALLASLRQAAERTSGSYTHLEELVLDIKTMEVHLLSPRPKTAVIKALLQSLQENFTSAGDLKTAAMIDRLHQ